MRPTRIALFLIVILAQAVVAQGPPPPLPPEFGNAVVVATNSVQLGRNVVVASGDVVVNNATPGPWLNELQLSLDQEVTTPAGYGLRADSIDIDGGAIVNGSVRYNILQSEGTINGNTVTPLALPVFGMLPPLPNRMANTNDIIVGDGETRVIGTGGGIGTFGHLVVGRNAIVRFPGGPLTFASVTADRGATFIFDGPGDLVVRGRVTLGAEVTVTPGVGITTKRRMFFVHGINGDDGLLLSTPAAVSIGRDSSVNASILAPNGTIEVGSSVDFTGALVGRDVRLGRESTLALRSGFRNLPPVAISQNVATDGTAPVAITLTGFDPDGDPLTFSIVVQPSLGTLSPVTPAGTTSAVVVFTPSVPNPDASFIFRVTDSEGFTANGVVTINNGVAPPPPTTVTALDAAYEADPGRPNIIDLPATAPPGVAVTVSIVPESGPSHGTLGPLNQPTSMPQRSGSVVYIPEDGYIGPDSFSFQACGVINGEEVCDQGTITLNVVGPPTENPDLAFDLSVTAASNTVTAINLASVPPPPDDGGGGDDEGGGGGRARFGGGVTTDASFLRPAAAAGSVSDANTDGIGDSHSTAPLVSAGTGAGNTRIHFEWEIGSLADLVDEIQTATVILRTHKAADSTEDTAIYLVGTDGDGALTNNDYERPAEPLRAVVMPVPAAQPVGSNGQFSFDVVNAVRDALRAGYTHLSIQGRVNEQMETEGPVSGLQVYTAAEGPDAPQLGITTGVTAPARTYRILSLPANGTLRDSAGNLITAVPYALPSAIVTYRSASGFTGQNSFAYDVTEGDLVDTATVTITVIAGSCAVDPAFCDGGR